MIAEIVERCAQVAEEVAKEHGSLTAYGAQKAARRIREEVREVSAIINDEREIEAWWVIMTEYKESCKKHPYFPSDPLRRTCIMMEEAGEAMKAAVDVTRYPITPEELTEKQQELWNEMVQTGAMVIKNLLAMIDDRERAKKEAKILS
jgi:hypothetical protein